MKKFVFTSGDINGIGPEITTKTFNKIYSPDKYKLILYSPGNVFEQTLDSESINFDYEIVKNIKSQNLKNEKITIVDFSKSTSQYGIPTAISGKVSYRSIFKAFELVYAKKADGIITSPISKEALKMAKINFLGHTEMLAEKSKSKNFAMMFLADKMIAALLTIHEPIKKIHKLITAKQIEKVICIVNNTLIKELKIKNPKIAILGLNPHAGENGNIGAEEIQIINPTIKKLKNKNINIEGAFVPDAFWANKLNEKFDAIIGMYHDQILIPFKMINFEKGVNYTAGLPIVRTSPDHGTAFDIAGKGIANPTSMIEAFKWADKIIEGRKDDKQSV